MKKIILVAIFGLLGRDAFGYQISEVRAYDEEQKTFISILASEQPQYRVFTIDKPALLIIDLLNAEGKPARVKNESKAVVSMQVSQRMSEPTKIARVAIELSRLFPYQILTDSKKVVLQIETGVRAVEKIEEPKEEILAEMPSSALPPLGKMEDSLIPKEIIIEREEEVATISLKFKDVDLRDALSAIAKKIKKDIVIGNSVEGDVTIELNDLSWKKALDIILKVHNYEWVEDGNVIRVDTRENLIKTALTTEIVPVSYDKAENMALLVTPMLDPDAGGKVTVDKRTNSLIFNTTLSNLNKIKEVIKKLDAPTPQVMIEVQMVGVKEDPQRAFGFQWGLANQTDYNFGGYDVNKGNLKSAEVGMGVPAKNQLTIGHIMDTKRLFFAISDLVTKEKANIIASPRVTTSDNQPAKITIGDNLPYMEEVSGGEGAPAIQASFMDVVTKLDITPKVNPDKSINLDIDVSDKTGQITAVTFRGLSFSAPQTSETNVKTQVLVNDGETIVIGGLTQRSDKITETSVPFLADFPFIGQFFRHTKIGKATTRPMKQEILIFITPHIINR